MSITVHNRLREMGIETDHRERLELDKEIENLTGLYCDGGVKELSDNEFVEIVNKVKKKKRIIVYA